MNILILDDESTILEELGRFFKGNGHRVVSAADGRTGWEYLSSSPESYDAVIADYKMPELDGLELLRLVRNNGYEIPVIIITAFIEEDTSLKALRLGAYDLITKPFSRKVLRLLLNRLESYQENKRELLEIIPYIRSRIQFRIPSQTRYIKSIVNSLKIHYLPLCRKYNLDEFRINLCLIEALTNAIIHGNFEIDSRIKEESWEAFEQMIHDREQSIDYAEREVIVRARINSQSLEFEIEDEGNGFDYQALPDFTDPRNLSYSGRGLFLIHSFMDAVSWNDKGNIIYLTKYIES